MLDFIRGNNMLNTGIWNLIGRTQYGDFKTAFEITKGAYKNRKKND